MILELSLSPPNHRLRQFSNFGIFYQKQIAWKEMEIGALRPLKLFRMYHSTPGLVSTQTPAKGLTVVDDCSTLGRNGNIHHYKPSHSIIVHVSGEQSCAFCSRLLNVMLIIREPRVNQRGPFGSLRSCPLTRISLNGSPRCAYRKLSLFFYRITRQDSHPRQ